VAEGGRVYSADVLSADLCGNGPVQQIHREDNPWRSLFALVRENF
jgi:hypothetical protein